MRHVFLCADANFVVPLAVTLRSLAVSQPADERLHVTVLSLGIASEDESRIAASADPVPVSFVPVEEHLPMDLPSVRHLNRAAYGRLRGVDLLPHDAGRAVYLDADTMVREDLGFLYSFELGRSPLGAVQSQVIPHVSNPLGLRQWRSLGLSPTTPYMNSGVLVIDTVAWRARDLGQSVLNFVYEHREHLSLADQDGFNGVLAGDFARLPLRWNQETALRLPNHFAYSVFPESEVDEAINNPAIVHFTGTTKPWQRGCDDPAAAEWLGLLRATEYRDFEPPPAHKQRPSVRQRARRVFSRLLGE